MVHVVADETHADEAHAGLRGHEFVASEIHLVEHGLHHLLLVAGHDHHTVAGSDVPAQRRHRVPAKDTRAPCVRASECRHRAPACGLAAAEGDDAKEDAAQETVARDAADEERHEGQQRQRQQHTPAAHAGKALAIEQFQCLVANDHAVEIEQHHASCLGGGLVERHRFHRLFHVFVTACVSPGGDAFRTACAARHPGLPRA